MAAATEPDAYVTGVETWRAERMARLQSDTGWLTVCGFHWLQSGENRFGSGDGVPVPLTDASLPAECGAFVVEGSGDGAVVRLVLADGVTAAVNDEPAESGRVLTPDDPGPPDEVKIGRLTLWVAKRAGSHAIRARDPECRLRTEFAGIESWPVDPAARVVGRYVPFAEPKPLEVPNQAGYVDTTLFYGEVAFEYGGRAVSLRPIVGAPGDTKLFFVFADETTGRETYGGGRFLYGDLSEDGTVVLDFNKAYNPPCSFNPYTTCSLPPPGNTLPVTVRAGEMAYRGAGH